MASFSASRTAISLTPPEEAYPLWTLRAGILWKALLWKVGRAVAPTRRARERRAPIMCCEGLLTAEVFGRAEYNKRVKGWKDGEVRPLEIERVELSSILSGVHQLS